MRVLIISFWFYPGRGGLERQSWQLSSGLVQRGNQVAAVTARRPGLVPFEVVEGIAIHRVWAGGGESLARAATFGTYANVLAFCFSLLFFLLRNARRYDLIQVQHAIFPAFVGGLAAIIFRRPIVIRVSGTGPTGNIAQLKRRWFNRLMLPVIRRANAFVAPTVDARSELQAAGFPRERIFVIPNGVDVQFFHPSSRRHDEKIRVFYPARFTFEKGHEILIRAWQQIQLPDAALILAGEGPLLPSIQHLVQSLGLERVQFTGEVEKVQDYFATADIFVLPSIAEGMSNALLEAMACGLPCVVSDLAANRELVQDGVNGMLFSAGNAEDLARVLGRLLRDGELRERLGRAARATVETQYTFETTLDRYCALYAQVLAGRMELGGCRENS